MARVRHGQDDWAAYHVSTRCVGQEFYLAGAREKQRIVSALDFYRRAGRYRLFGFVVMDNHVHFIIQPRPRILAIPAETVDDIAAGREPRRAKGQQVAAGQEPRRAEGQQDAAGLEPRRAKGQQDAAGQEPRRAKAEGPVLFSLSDIVRDFKSWTSRTNAQKPAGKPLWERRYDDNFVTSAEELRRVLEYIHDNPVRAGVVGSCEEYAWSSAHSYLRDGREIIEIDADWWQY